MFFTQEVRAANVFVAARNQENIYSRRRSTSRGQEFAKDYHGFLKEEQGHQTEDFLMGLGGPTTNTLWLDLHFIHF